MSNSLEVISDLQSFRLMLPSSILTTYDTIPENVLEMSDEELIKIVKPDIILERLRISFWLEHDRANRTKTLMNVANIISGICTQQYYTKQIAISSVKTAYMCRPPTSIIVAANEALVIAIEQMREILVLPNTDPKGRIDSKLLGIKAKLFTELYNRVKGAVVQKQQIDQRNLSLSIEQKSDPTYDIEDIDARIKQLESEKTPTPVIEIENESKEEI